MLIIQLDCLSFPSATRVAGSDTIIPPFTSPINAINRPIPAATAYLSDCGIDLTINFLSPAIDIIKYNIPDTKTAARACCHVSPIPKTNVNAKNALSPIPGANATGSLANIPIARVANAEINAVAKNKPVTDIPVSPRILGFTKRI